MLATATALPTELSVRFIKLRERLGFTSQSALARAIGADQPTISRIESDGRSIPDRILRLLLEQYGVSSKWLLSGDGEMFSRQSAPAIQQTDFPVAGQLVEVPLLNMSAQLGALATHNLKVMRDHLDLVEVVKPRGVSADALLAVDVSGDSMSPVLVPPARIIVSPIPMTDILNRYMYLVRYVEDDGAASMVTAVKYVEIKRAERMVILHSENRDDYPPIELMGWQLKETYHIHQITYPGTPNFKMS